MFEFFIILCLSADENVCRELSRTTEDCAAEVRHLNNSLSIKNEERPDGELVVKAIGCFPAKKPKLKT